ncbi:hypothetical protein H2204_004709 [Knufia peltigerae]|uniref:Carboxymuconolactone decarboxylase-like domain-containing protein n=1 Tax=Knufia peltigerae TaxID=1002370 RepID=A0AA38Y885_9EURO|nr:hypothetical protein H2204_004709 [Knufia peltigerae]
MASSINTQLQGTELGQQMASRFLGEEFLASVKAKLKDDIFTKTSMEFIYDPCFTGYARPGLEFRERALMNIAMLIALNREAELRIHIRAAVNNGLTEQAICEACRHAMIYCGVPAGRTAMIVASEIFAQLKESGEYPKKA